MENFDRESEVLGELHFDNLVGGGEASLRFMREIGAIAPTDCSIAISDGNGRREERIFAQGRTL